MSLSQLPRRCTKVYLGLTVLSIRLSDKLRNITTLFQGQISPKKMSVNPNKTIPKEIFCFDFIWILKLNLAKFSCLEYSSWHKYCCSSDQKSSSNPYHLILQQNNFGISFTGYAYIRVIYTLRCHTSALQGKSCKR